MSKEYKYPGCKCEEIFGLGKLCGDPGCPQVVASHESMRKMLVEFDELLTADLKSATQVKRAGDPSAG